MEMCLHRGAHSPLCIYLLLEIHVLNKPCLVTSSLLEIWHGFWEAQLSWAVFHILYSVILSMDLAYQLTMNMPPCRVANDT